MHVRSLSVLALLLLSECSAPGVLSLDGFTQWRTGHDDKTKQLFPGNTNGLVRENDKMIVHVKFQVAQYGEVSFPINRETPEGAEALRVDLSGSKFITLSYKSNQKFILQLRQTAVHGGSQNHVTLPASEDYTTATILLSDFSGGLSPLDLSNVSKFNFAFLENNPADGFAELYVEKFEIDNYKP